MIYTENGFYMIGVSDMKELKAGRNKKDVTMATAWKEHCGDSLQSY